MEVQAVWTEYGYGICFDLFTLHSLETPVLYQTHIHPILTDQHSFFIDLTRQYFPVESLPNHLLKSTGFIENG